jgi:hypothetical protein
VLHQLSNGSPRNASSVNDLILMAGIKRAVFTFGARPDGSPFALGSVTPCRPDLRLSCQGVLERRRGRMTVRWASPPATTLRTLESSIIQGVQGSCLGGEAQSACRHHATLGLVQAPILPALPPNQLQARKNAVQVLYWYKRGQPTDVAWMQRSDGSKSKRFLRNHESDNWGEAGGSDGGRR